MRRMAHYLRTLVAEGNLIDQLIFAGLIVKRFSRVGESLPFFAIAETLIGTSDSPNYRDVNRKQLLAKICKAALPLRRLSFKRQKKIYVTFMLSKRKGKFDKHLANCDPSSQSAG